MDALSTYTLLLPCWDPTMTTPGCLSRFTSPWTERRSTQSNRISMSWRVRAQGLVVWMVKTGEHRSFYKKDPEVSQIQPAIQGNNSGVRAMATRRAKTCHKW
jgi:hypothetical protein